MNKDKRIINILDNIKYWDGCPQDYIDVIPDLINHLESKDNSVLHNIKENQFHCDGLTHVGFRCDKQCNRCKKLWHESKIDSP